MTTKDGTPKWVLYVCGTVIMLGTLAAITFLVYHNKETTQISAYVNTVLNFLALIGIGGIGLGVASAAKHSERARETTEKIAENTNGLLQHTNERLTQLEEKQDGQ